MATTWPGPRRILQARQTLSVADGASSVGHGDVSHGD